MTIRALRRHSRSSSLIILFAVMIQAAAATATVACPEMTPASESTAHSGHLVLPADIQVGSDSSCDCSTGEPVESDENEIGSCAMAAHCVSSPAVVAEGSMLTVPAIHVRAVEHPRVRAQLVTLSHPTPPPRV